MKRNFISVRLMAVVAAWLMFASVADAQSKRVKVFQEEFSALQQQFWSKSGEGKLEEALVPLKAMATMIDTTTVDQDPDTPIARSMLTMQQGLTYYDIACIYGRLGKKKLALEAFSQSVAYGYDDYNHVLEDHDLDAIRKEKKFLALLTELEGRGPLPTLRKSAPYAKDECSAKESPFKYQSAEALNLRMTREYLKLDSVAGQGDELSKILRLLHFVHDNMPHNGSTRAFCELDAIDLYNYSKTTGLGMNCRQLAIALSEMCLALDIPARYVTCMPADPNDYECHVINAIWSRDMQKWLYIDPTMDAWVTDENGTMLSIQEVRDRLIDGRELNLCETANWNHESTQTKEQYLEQYMAKNLYYLVCKKLYRFNTESLYRENPADADIKLIPVGFENNNYQCDSTTDPEWFWAPPTAGE